MVALNVAKDIEPVLMLARQGRFDEAATATSALLLRAPANAALHALAGALALQRGRLEEAVTHLDKALAGHPHDGMARSDLIEALHRLGQHERVLSLADMNFLRADASRVLARIAGASAQAIERYAEAISYYELVLSAQPRDWTIWSNLGNAFLALGQAAKAIDAQRQALKIAPDAQPVLLNLAHALIEATHCDEAETVLADMIRNFPEDANPHFSRFGMLYANGREEEAQQALVRAAALAPERGDIQLALGQHATRLGLFERAAEAFYRAEALKMAPDEVYVGLGGALERLNREDKLPDLRKQAETQGASAPALAFLDLMIARRAGHHEQAFALLDQARAVLSEDQAAQIEGALLQQLGRHEAAFSAFARMNAIMATDPSAPRQRAKAYREAIQADSARIDAGVLTHWTSYAPPPRGLPAPIFLLGFPRSGTTLLDTMLMGDSRVAVLEEESFISQIANSIGSTDLATMTDAQITAAREQYFDLVREKVVLKPETILIDKHPMHLAKMLTIHRLFPDARYLLALRHPFDAVLSCFMAHFRLNDAMANFLDLEDAAALYDDAFGLWEKLREHAGLDVRQVVYENLVREPQAELLPVFKGLGLEWPEGGPDHQRAARERGLVITASYAQVTQPLYTRAAGRWRHYAAPLAPVMPSLERWVRHFGYSSDSIEVA